MALHRPGPARNVGRCAIRQRDQLVRVKAADSYRCLARQSCTREVRSSHSALLAMGRPRVLFWEACRAVCSSDR